MQVMYWLIIWVWIKWDIKHLFSAVFIDEIKQFSMSVFGVTFIAGYRTLKSTRILITRRPWNNHHHTFSRDITFNWVMTRWAIFALSGFPGLLVQFEVSLEFVHHFRDPFRSASPHVISQCQGLLQQGFLTVKSAGEILSNFYSIRYHVVDDDDKVW